MTTLQLNARKDVSVWGSEVNDESWEFRGDADEGLQTKDYSQRKEEGEWLTVKV